jgi:heme/copper-type cytochrome/quinol oxidase subunit 2
MLLITNIKNKIIFLLFIIFLIEELFSFKFTINLTDCPENGQLFFQEPSSYVMEGLVSFNAHLLFLIFSIVMLVAWLLTFTVFVYQETESSPQSFSFVHSQKIEIVWTLAPALILLLLAAPSFSLLYSMDEVFYPDLSFKVLGHQWFWEYEISDFLLLNCLDNGQLKFVSYILADEGLRFNHLKGYIQFLETNKRVIFPINTNIRIMITSMDVLHSWTIPSVGLKLDACLGRLNSINLLLKRIGLTMGQCSELCGLNHGFMPISGLGLDIRSYGHFIEASSLKNEETYVSDEVAVQVYLEAWESISQSQETKN